MLEHDIGFYSIADRLFIRENSPLVMPKKPPEIRILKDEVANRIAAGEVVERPASAVKELIENALDADADRIEVEFRRGGKTLIRVRDNGCGMTQEQALMSLEAHATSKIESPDDLFKISTYGFRGEAVPSIASVSKFTMRTRAEDCADGTEIEVLGGTIKSVKECGVPRGTEICVENLFYGVPARRKFLKSDNAEASHISRLCRLYALLLPNVAFSLVEDSRLIFRSETGMSLKDRIARIFGSDISEKLVDLPKATGQGFSVHGAISKPAESYATNRNICVFINSRPVECRAVFSALKESYASLMPKGRYAAAFLFITLDPASVDVNVHPTKREVRLRDEFGLRNFLCRVFSDTLNSASGKFAGSSTDETYKTDEREITESAIETNDNLRNTHIPCPPPPPPRPIFTPENDFTFAGQSTGNSTDKSAENSRDFLDAPQNSAIKISPREKLKSDISEIEKKFFDKEQIGNKDEQKTDENSAHFPPAKKSSPLADWKFLGTVKQKWILFQTAKGVLFVSILNAMRRVRFERMIAALKSRASIDSQSLLIPVNVRFERGDAEYFETAKDAFRACGFEIEDFGKYFYRVSSAPAWLDVSEIEPFLRDFAEMAREEGMPLTKEKLTDEIFARLAVKRNRTGAGNIDEHTARTLTEELLTLQNHATSPDGKTIMREISDSEISKFFE